MVMMKMKQKKLRDRMNKVRSYLIENTEWYRPFLVHAWILRIINDRRAMSTSLLFSLSLFLSYTTSLTRSYSLFPFISNSPFLAFSLSLTLSLYIIVYFYYTTPLSSTGVYILFAPSHEHNLRRVVVVIETLVMRFRRTSLLSYSLSSFVK